MERKHKVCMYLPPFAGDYSGVCSALFDLGGMICIHDAAGCTGNYTHFDEPRWYGSHSMVFCTGFRKVDAVLGDDEKVIGKIVKNALQYHPKFIAIVGSPVPNVIGFDFNGVSRAVENRTGIPCFGFATAGIKGTYLDGIVMAFQALTGYYVSHPEKRDAWHEGNMVAIPGISPLDMEQGVFSSLVERLVSDGVAICNPSDCFGYLPFYQYPEKVSLNLVWNQAGLRIARFMKEKYNTPYIVRFPVGEELYDEYLSLIGERKVAVLGEKTEPYSGTSDVVPGKENPRKGTVIADGVVARSIGNYLERNGIDLQYYSISGDSEEADYLRDEDAILDVVRKEEDILIADPLFLQYAEEARTQIALPQYAVSSRIGKDKNFNYLDPDTWLDLIS